MEKHFYKRLVCDPLATGDLTRFSEIWRRKTKRDLHAARSVQICHERGSLLLRGSGSRLLLKKAPPSCALPPFGFLVLRFRTGAFLPLALWIYALVLLVPIKYNYLQFKVSCWQALLIPHKKARRLV